MLKQIIGLSMATLLMAGCANNKTKTVDLHGAWDLNYSLSECGDESYQRAARFFYAKGDIEKLGLVHVNGQKPIPRGASQCDVAYKKDVFDFYGYPIEQTAQQFLEMFILESGWGDDELAVVHFNNKQIELVRMSPDGREWRWQLQR